MKHLKNSRQKSALSRLEDQLKSGVKTQKGTIDTKIPLTKSDIERINKEIESIKKNME